MTTANNVNTNKTIDIKPIVIEQSDACDVLLLADATTGKGIWMGSDLEWQIDPEYGDLDTDADKIEDVSAPTRTNGRPRPTRSSPNTV